MPRITIIIPHFNGWDILNECLKSLQKNGFSDCEIIVVDNGSTDNSVQQIKSNFPDVKTIESPVNRGYAGGCNLGVDHAQGEFIVFLNNDTTHEPGWLKNLSDRLDSNHNISSVQPKIRNYHNKIKFDYAGGAGGYMDMFCFPFVRGRVFDTLEVDHKQYDDERPIFWASGTAFMTRKDVFQKIGGFDETLFAHMEEIDYHWKCHLKGYSVWVVPQAIIYHKGGATLSYQSPEKTYLNHRNSLILLITNYSFFVSIYLLLPRMVLESAACLKYILSGEIRHAIAQIRAWAWILFHPHVMCRRRWQTFKLR